MPRRISLAVALAFTTVVTFAVIAIGAQSGVFSDHKTSDAAAEEAPAAAAAEAAAPAAPADAPASAAPQVIVQTDYVDVQDPPLPAAAATAKPAAAGTADAGASPTASSAATRTPVATRTAAATATTQPAATATAAPSKPTATAGASLPAEIEFVGSVTAISGNQVTFNHGGALTTVQVSNPGALAVGVTAHVHALLKAGGYVATEVQVGG
ncbi:MAG: hypothetical protein EPO22_14625 [Dehalococcoidia bacterium]|nr:MAG: hypothetical protein EPO22_14625 [Dehalococcoidia bacterium]